MSIFKALKDLVSKRHLPSRTEASPFASCQICNADAPFLDAIDFNKSCEEARGMFLPPSGVKINYYLCGQCGFCFAPEFHEWTRQDFAERIYNGDYRLVDPDYELARPVANAEFIDGQFGKSKNILRHLDYGGGNGLLSKQLRGKGWDSQSYDPFEDPELLVADLGQFDLVTAFEVFEHVPDIDQLIANLGALCKTKGIILFSTLISDGEIVAGRPLDWWYASPRNGHISLFSSRSLAHCLASKGFVFGSFSENAHLTFREVPEWANHLINAQPPGS